jgi:hypothetical protein
LKEMEDVESERVAPTGDRKSSSSLELETLGVTKKQSHNWQKLADLDEDDFEAKTASASDSGGRFVYRDLPDIGTPSEAPRSDGGPYCGGT